MMIILLQFLLVDENEMKESMVINLRRSAKCFGTIQILRHTFLKRDGLTDYLLITDFTRAALSNPRVEQWFSSSQRWKRGCPPKQMQTILWPTIHFSQTLLSFFRPLIELRLSHFVASECFCG